MSKKKNRVIKCKDCGKIIECEIHGSEGISEFQHDMDGSWYYSCGKCIDEGVTSVLGSIKHWCNGLATSENKQLQLSEGISNYFKRLDRKKVMQKG